MYWRYIDIYVRILSTRQKFKRYDRKRDIKYINIKCIMLKLKTPVTKKDIFLEEKKKTFSSYELIQNNVN